MFFRKIKIVRFSIAILLIAVFLSTYVFGDTVNNSSITTSFADNLVEKAVADIITSGFMEANSNRQVHPFELQPVESLFSLDDFQKVTSSDKLELWLSHKMGSLRILNKESGYIWGALPLEGAEGLNTTWNSYGNSLVAIECFDETGKESRHSIGKDASISYKMKENGMTCEIYFEQVGISFSVDVILKNNKLSLALIDGTMIEGINDSSFTLKSVSFMPFLGSSYSDMIDGYMLIPDGSGAIIRFREPGNYSSTYESKIYGKDFGIESASNVLTNNIKEEHQILMPVFGMVHGARQNSFLAVVEQGAEYASIISTPALTNNPYNWTTVRFDYRQKYTMNISRKGGAGAVVPQAHMNKITPAISYNFLEGDDAHYDGMAVFYRDMMIKNKILVEKENKYKETPLRIEVLGADKKDEFFGTSLTTFTTVEEAMNIVKTLSEKGINDVSFIYRCFTKNNEVDSKYLSRLGTVDGHRELQKMLVNNGGRFFYYLNPVSANSKQINLRTEAANNLSNKVIKKDNTYFYRMNKVENLIVKAMERDNNSNYAIDGLSYRLFGDFTSTKEMTRLENYEKTLSMVSMLHEGRALSLYQPNQYLWKFADEMYDLPITNSQIFYESDSVPFLQIVLSGSTRMFASPMNTSSFSIESILRHIEYGMLPSFVVTQCESIELYNSAQEKYSSTNFNDWEENITNSYKLIAQGLLSVIDSKIIRHDALDKGLIRIKYENAITMLINYTDLPQQVDNTNIPAKSYVVVGNGE